MPAEQQDGGDRLHDRAAEVAREHQRAARQPVRPHAGGEDEERHRHDLRGEHEPELRRAAVEPVEDRERERDREQRVAEHRHGLAGEQQPEVAVAEDGDVGRGPWAARDRIRARGMSRDGARRRPRGMDHIVITGATGVIGRRSVDALITAGHRVTGVTRSERGRRQLEARGARAVAADVFDPDSLAAAFAGADAVVNLLTHLPAADRMGVPGAWDENDRLRREASAAVAEAAQAAGAARLVQESVAFAYADGGDAWLEEDAPVAGAGPSASALVAEANVREHFAGAAIVLRFGLFVGPDSALTQADVEGARHGRSPSVGRRDAFLPTVWLDDAGAAVAAAVDRRAGRDLQRDGQRPADPRRGRPGPRRGGRAAAAARLRRGPARARAGRALAARLEPPAARRDRLGTARPRRDRGLEPDRGARRRLTGAAEAADARIDTARAGHRRRHVARSATGCTTQARRGGEAPRSSLKHLWRLGGDSPGS